MLARFSLVAAFVDTKRVIRAVDSIELAARLHLNVAIVEVRVDSHWIC